jgi:hypothetical protein|nr:MAG TPA: hypothetical protein [Ackermannviridae sp.]
MKILPFPNKTEDTLNISIFGDIVLFGYMKLHISEIIERKLPEECKNYLNSHYMPPHIIENILEAHHQNSCEHPNEQLADWAYLEKTHPPQYIAGLATENRNVIETILEKNLYFGKLGLSLNPVATESDLIRILKSEDVSENMRFNITKHQNLTKEVIKLFASEDCRLVIESLKLRKNIGSLIDPDVRLHFQKCGSKLIRDAFIYNKKISDF